MQVRSDLVRQENRTVNTLKIDLIIIITLDFVSEL
jgi:hypothetical protein